MISVMHFRDDRPMETAWTALRIQLGLAECLGEVKPVRGETVNGEGFLLAPSATCARTRSPAPLPRSP
jgi:hypothetical protein